MRVLVVGAMGKMGREVCRAVLDDEELQLVGVVDQPRFGGDRDFGELAGLGPVGFPLQTDLLAALGQSRAEVAVDFTHPESVMDNLRTVVDSSVHAVVGTTGLTAEDYESIGGWLNGKPSNVFIAPNFAIGAVLMMHFAEQAARHLPALEIIELHHDKKADAPSGTALATAARVARAGGCSVDVGMEVTPGARGGLADGVRVHSIRLPGLVAHQEVILGGKGQILSIRHDSIDRTSFMPGVVMAIKAISGLEQPLTVGLDKLLGL